MDFRSAPPVVDAVVACAKRGIYGYTDPPEELTRLTIGRLGSMYGCVDAHEDWLTWLPGLVPALHYAVRATHAQSVAVLTPAYPPFLAAPPHNGAVLTEVPMMVGEIQTEIQTSCSSGGIEIHFDVNWELLDASLAQPSTALLLLCSAVQRLNPSRSPSQLKGHDPTSDLTRAAPSTAHSNPAVRV